MRSRGYDCTMRRLDSLLLAGVAMLLVHQLAYTVSSVAGVETSVAHGHLEAAWLFGSLTAIGALARSITASLRRRSYDLDGVWAFTGWIVAGYLSLETVERIVDGHGATALLGEPVFWLGLVLAPLVAFALAWSLRTVAQIVADVIVNRASPASLVAPSASLGETSVSLPSPLFSSFVVSRRGPPALVLHL